MEEKICISKELYDKLLEVLYLMSIAHFSESEKKQMVDELVNECVQLMLKQDKLDVRS